MGVCRLIKGDRVRVISGCQTYMKAGTVIEIVIKEWTDQYYYARVKLDDGRFRIYSQASLSHIGHVELSENYKNKNKTKESNNMAVKGNFRVAVVKFVQGYNMNKEYGFALFDEDVVVGDYVLCDSSNGYGVAEVVNIKTQTEYGSDVTKEIICKCDFTAYNNRKVVREQRKALKAQMDKMVADNQELILYRAVAEKNSEMAALLSQYMSLGDV